MKQVTCIIYGWQRHRFSALVDTNYVRFNAIYKHCQSVERGRAFIDYLEKNLLSPNAV